MSVRVLFVGILCLLLVSGLAAQPGTPPTPTNLTAKVVEGPAVELGWDAAGLWGYKVYRSVGDETSFQLIGATALTASFTDASPVVGQMNYYRVTAVGMGQGSQEGSPSASVGVNVPIDATKGVIQGTVTDEATGLPLPWVQIQFFIAGSDFSTWVQALTDLSGKYQVQLPVDTYLLHALPPYTGGREYQPEWYDNKPDSTSATPVDVAGGTIVTADFALAYRSATAWVQLIHNAADPAAAQVDVYLNGERILNDFAFRKATPFLPVPAGVALQVGVAAGSSSSAADTLKNFDLTLTEGERYIAVANGVLDPASFAANPDGRSTAFTLFILPGAKMKGSAGNVEIAAEHGATDAPTVDVVARGVATLVDNAAYGDITGYLAVPPASYILDVTDASGTVTVASFNADLSGLADRAAFVFASGFLTPAQNQNGPAFGLFAALPNGLVVAFPPLVEGPTGTIAGTVVDEATQSPLAGVKILFFKQNAVVPMAGWALTGNNGEYSAVLGTGTYLVKAEPGAMYVPEWYDNVANPANATPVEVQENQTATANFALAKPVLPPMVEISGVVTDEAGAPIAGAAVILMRTIQEMHTLAVTPGAVPGIGSESMMIDHLGQCRGVIWKGMTDAKGEYTASVRGGSSYIAVAAKAGYLPEYYDNKPNPAHADVIVVGSDNITGIDFSLAALPNILNSVAGTVRDELGTGVPSRIVLIPVHPSPGVGVRFGHTDGDGSYMLTHVLAGDYHVLAIPFSGYAPAFYKDGAYGIIHWQDADIVTVSGAVSGIDIGVVAIKHVGLAQLTGKAATSTGTPVEGTSVFVTTATGEIVGYGLTDAEGAYTIANVPPGTLTLKASRDGYNSSETTVSVSTNAFAATGDIPMTPATVTGVVPPETTPQTFALHQNYPNPFNPSTSIVVDLPANSLVRLTIYNVLGQEMVTLVDGLLTAGRSQVVWNGADNAGRPVASGSYYYRLTATTPEGQIVFMQTKTMLLLK